MSCDVQQNVERILIYGRVDAGHPQRGKELSEVDQRFCWFKEETWKRRRDPSFSKVIAGCHEYLTQAQGELVVRGKAKREATGVVLHSYHLISPLPLTYFTH